MNTPNIVIVAFIAIAIGITLFFKWDLNQFRKKLYVGQHVDMTLSLSDTVEGDMSEEALADLVVTLKKDAIEIIQNALRATTTFEVKAT